MAWYFCFGCDFVVLSYNFMVSYTTTTHNSYRYFYVAVSVALTCKRQIKKVLDTSYKLLKNLESRISKTKTMLLIIRLTQQIAETYCVTIHLLLVESSTTVDNTAALLFRRWQFFTKHIFHDNTLLCRQNLAWLIQC